MYDKDLLFFYGDECPECKEGEGFVDRLIREGYEIHKLEVWNNKENYQLLEKLDCGADMCGGIPFYLNQKTKKTICGEATYEEIKYWAESK